MLGIYRRAIFLRNQDTTLVRILPVANRAMVYVISSNSFFRIRSRGGCRRRHNFFQIREIPSSEYAVLAVADRAIASSKPERFLLQDTQSWMLQTAP